MITDTSTSSQLSELPDSGSSKVIYIRPKFRYVFIMSFFPMVIYCSVFAVLLYLPSIFNWAFIPLVVVLATSFLFIVWTLLRVITTSWTLSADQLCFMRGSSHGGLIISNCIVWRIISLESLFPSECWDSARFIWSQRIHPRRWCKFSVFRI